VLIIVTVSVEYRIYYYWMFLHHGPYFWTRGWTQTQSLGFSNWVVYFPESSLTRYPTKWCHINNTTSLLHISDSDPSVITLDSNFCSWLIGLLEFGVSLALDPSVNQLQSFVVVPSVKVPREPSDTYNYVRSRALHWVPIPMPMGFGWAWVQ